MKLLLKYYILLHVKQSTTYCKVSQKFTCDANIKNMKFQWFTIWLPSCGHNFIPIEGDLIIHLMMSVGFVKVCFQSSVLPIKPSHMYKFFIQIATWMIDIF